LECWKKHRRTESKGGGGVVDGMLTETYKYYLIKLNIMATIQYVGLNELTSSEKQLVKNLTEEYADKIDRSLPNMDQFIVHIKTQKATGGKRKFSIKSRASVGNKVFETKAFDWDLARTLHKVFKDMENHIKHVLRNDTSYKKPYA
tara:strand:+ start:87 stop:524 length:438 start_codon:yes stop_codon:yes gene_type:complete